MRVFVKFINGLISLVTALVLLLAGAYASYCLWDNEQIYEAADNVRAELLSLKPKIDLTNPEDTGPTFAELSAINPDVCAWVTMDNTHIDHPVLQGETNLDYINTDVYGNFALAGSIFMDSRSDNTFSEPYSLLYGHHMVNGGMFGDLDLYKNKSFFEGNQSGMLILPDRAMKLEVFACMMVIASDDKIFDPLAWNDGVSGLLDYAEENSLCLNSETIALLREMINEGENPQVLALTTCSSDFTDARTIVLAAMSDYHQEDREDEKS